MTDIKALCNPDVQGIQKRGGVMRNIIAVISLVLFLKAHVAVGAVHTVLVPEEFLDKDIVVQYCIDEQLCKGKKELYLRDFIKAFSEYYRVNLVIEDLDDLEKEYEFFDNVKKSSVGYQYQGAGLDSFAYCEYKRGECTIKREVLCDDRYWNDDLNVEYCEVFKYKIDGKNVVVDENLIDQDEVFWHIMQTLPDDRLDIRVFKRMETTFD